MKRSFPPRPQLSFGQLLFTVIILPLLLACAGKQKEPSGEALQKEKDAILAVIEKETASFFSRDYEAWKSTFAQQIMLFRHGATRTEHLTPALVGNK